jgi:hypothetical protein
VYNKRKRKKKLIGSTKSPEKKKINKKMENPPNLPRPSFSVTIGGVVKE